MEPAKNLIRVCVVEDQREIRDGLAALIDATDGFSCDGSFSSMEAALPRIQAIVPDVALIDIDLPGMSGTEGARVLHDRMPTVAALILTIHHDNERILEALCGGAKGYLLKNTPPVRLMEALRDTAGGGSPMSPEIARQVVDLFRQFAPPAKADYRLTPHEARILKMLVNGENYKTVAQALAVSVNTVSYHVRHIYDKLHVHSRSEAVAKALRSGLLK